MEIDIELEKYVPVLLKRRTTRIYRIYPPPVAKRMNLNVYNLSIWMFTGTFLAFRGEFVKNKASRQLIATTNEGMKEVALRYDHL